MGHRWGTTTVLGYVRKGYALRRVVESAIAERDGSSDCFYCGGYATHLDHVTAKFHGGSDSIENLVLACRECNFDQENVDVPLARPVRQADAGLESGRHQPSLRRRVRSNFRSDGSERREKVKRTKVEAAF